MKCGHRPKLADLDKWGWKHYRGKQFRYVYFLCDKKERKQLLKESPIDWKQPNPKNVDLEWKIQNLKTGKWASSPTIDYDPFAINKHGYTVRKNIGTVNSVKAMRTFFEF